MAEWTKSKYTGLRYREHATRTVGVGRSKRPLRYYVMTFKWQGKTVSEALGWEGEYVRDEEAARKISQKLSDNRKDNTPPFTLAEYRQENAEALEIKRSEAEAESLRKITFNKIFTEHYFHHAKQNRRSSVSVVREENLFRLWISPVIGNKPLMDIAPINLERIKKNMSQAGKAARSIQYALAVIRQVYNYALVNDLFDGKNPAGQTGNVKRPKIDNRRTRFLSRQEATDLLAELEQRSPQVHDMALLSLHTGCRAGEVFNLRWQDVDLIGGTAILKDTKSGKNRPVFFTDDVKNMLTGRKQGGPNDLVFPNEKRRKLLEYQIAFSGLWRNSV